jgi:hypothetical protein
MTYVVSAVQHDISEGDPSQQTFGLFSPARKHIHVGPTQLVYVPREGSVVAVYDDETSVYGRVIWSDGSLSNQRKLVERASSASVSCLTEGYFAGFIMLVYKDEKHIPGPIMTALYTVDPQGPQAGPMSPFSLKDGSFWGPQAVAYNGEDYYVRAPTITTIYSGSEFVVAYQESNSPYFEKIMLKRIDLKEWERLNYWQHQGHYQQQNYRLEQLKKYWYPADAHVQLASYGPAAEFIYVGQTEGKLFKGQYEFKLTSNAIWNDHQNTNIPGIFPTLATNSAMAWFAWCSPGEKKEGSYSDIYMRAWSSVVPIQVNETKGIHNRPAMTYLRGKQGDPQNKFIIVWDCQDKGILGRVFNDDGSPDTREFVVSQAEQFTNDFAPSIVAKPNYEFVVLWCRSSGGWGGEIKATEIKLGGII